MKKRLWPYSIIIFSFAGVILIGTILLLLPISTNKNVSISVIDALFTATSAVCVTGLSSVPSLISTFSPFGQVVIVVLIEIGGLGFVTLAIFIFTLLGAKIGMGERLLLREALNQNHIKGVVNLVRISVLYTLCFQLIGMIINMFVFTKEFSFGQALWKSTFHTIAAFNNAGFDILGSTSLEAYQHHVLLNINTALLIILGGIGFLVIYDVFKTRNWKKLSIHSKIVLTTTLFLLITGTLALKLTEGKNISWLAAFFQSTSARTAGFATINLTTLSNAGILVLCILMYIGASPASTGGGIKTTTFYVMYRYIASFAKGDKAITHNRAISDKSISKAFVLVILSIAYIILIILLINMIEVKRATPNDDFKKIFTEVISAFATTGYSLHYTSTLHWMSKFLLILTMFIGRLGPITIVSVLNRKWNMEVKEPIKYIEEKIIIG